MSTNQPTLDRNILKEIRKAVLEGMDKKFEQLLNEQFGPNPIHQRTIIESCITESKDNIFHLLSTIPNFKPITPYLTNNDNFLLTANVENRIKIFSKILEIFTNSDPLNVTMTGVPNPNIGQYIGTTNNRNETPLYLACRYNLTPLIKVFIQYDPQHLNINQGDQDNLSIFPIMVRDNRLDIIELLFAVPQLDVNITMNSMIKGQEQPVQGITPLMMACIHGLSPVVEKLLSDKNTFRKPVDINAQDSTGCTALFYAIQYNRLDIVKKLVETKNIQINIKNNSQQTVLLYSFLHRGKKYGIIKELLKLNSQHLDINAQDKDGLTVLHYAVDEKHYEPQVFSTIIEKFQDQLDVTLKDKNKLTAYNIAEKYDNKVAMELLRTENRTLNNPVE